MTDPDLAAGALPASILVESSGFAGGGTAACPKLVAAADPDAVLFVSYGADPSARLASVRELGADPDAALAILVGEAGAPAGDFDGVETVSAPSDLTGLGIAISEALSGGDGRTAVCLDSVTSLLQYVDVETAFEFLHVFVGRCYRRDAIGHLHVDPGAHDDRTVAQFASLVDGRVAVDEDGSIASASASIRSQ